MCANSVETYKNLLSKFAILCKQYNWILARQQNIWMWNWCNVGHLRNYPHPQRKREKKHFLLWLVDSCYRLNQCCFYIIHHLVLITKWLLYLAAKSGVDPSGCVELVRHVKLGCPNLKFSGLMTIGMPDYSSTPENFRVIISYLSQGVIWSHLLSDLIIPLKLVDLDSASIWYGTVTMELQNGGLQGTWDGGRTMWAVNGHVWRLWTSGEEYNLLAFSVIFTAMNHVRGLDFRVMLTAF